jgi:hypothetical protein
VLQPGVNSNYPLNDLGNGKLFAEVFKNDAVYCVERHSWYVYNGVIWEYKDALFKTVIAYNEEVHPRTDAEWYANNTIYERVK